MTDDRKDERPKGLAESNDLCREANPLGLAQPCRRLPVQESVGWEKQLIKTPSLLANKICPPLG